jgi:hypothetical protein
LTLAPSEYRRTSSPEGKMKTRMSADGWLDLSDRKRVRMPGSHDHNVEPAPEAEALAFLLSHSFPGHRRIVRTMTLKERAKIRMAMWADSVGARMSHIDRIWRNITEPVTPPTSDKPELIQVVRYGSEWVYPIYLDGSVTRVLPHGGVPGPASQKELKGTEFQLELQPAD